MTEQDLFRPTTDELCAQALARLRHWINRAAAQQARRWRERWGYV